MEYRGYDSAGIVTLDPSHQLEVHKSVGKVNDLVSSLNGRTPQGILGIGHTRWATHGRPTLANSHPHTDCHHQIGVVHNGIVENFLELKRDLLARGHTFTSETDSEVIVHLIEEGLAQGSGFEEAFSRLPSYLRGANAVVAIYQGEPGKILALRLGNAGGITVAYREGETMIGSDLPAVLTLANEVAFLDDGEMVAASREEPRYVGLTGKRVAKRTQKIKPDTVAVGKEGYRHFMLKEIMEQPQAMASAFRSLVDFEDGRVILEDFSLAESEIQQLQRVVLIGCGTSLYAAMIGRHLVEQLSGLPAEAESSSEFRYRNYQLDATTLVVSIGQSGETADTLAAMEAVKSQEGRLVTLCNAEGSQATRLAETTLLMRSGLEIGVASTKTFMASLSLLTLLSMYLGQAKGALERSHCRQMLMELALLPNQLGQLLADHRPYKTLAQALYRYDHFLYLGRGINYPIALEGALKLKEISYTHAEGYPAGEMKHGPIALIDHRMATVALAPRSLHYDKMVNNIKEIKARDGMVITVATEGDLELASGVDHVLYIPDAPALLTPFLAVVALQLLAYYIAIQRGCDVDQPRNLAKSVTVE